jgi:hypothetical protein
MPITLQAAGNSASDKDAWEYVDHAVWDGPLVGEINFSLDKTKYTQWVLTYHIDPNPTWSGASLKFMYEGQNEVSSVNPEPYPTAVAPAPVGLQNTWRSATLYTGVTFTEPNYANEFGNDTFPYLWLQGNGAPWTEYSTILISVPDTDVNYASARNFGGLITNKVIGDPPAAYNPYAYNEESAGTMTAKFARQTTTLKITSNNASYGVSRKGYFILQGVKR